MGAILYRYVDLTQNIPNHIQFFLFTTGIYSGRIWTAIIAITLLFLESRSLCFVIFKLQPAFYVFGWAVPAVLSILLLVFDKDKTIPPDNRNPNFAYGTFQAIVAVFLLVLCFIVSAGCLVLYEMHKRQRDAEHRPINDEEQPVIDENADSSEDEELLSETESTKQTARITPKQNGDANGCGLKNCCNSSYCTQNPPVQTPKVKIMPTIPEIGNNSRGNTSQKVNSQVVDIEDLFAEDRTSDKERLMQDDTSTKAVKRFGTPRTRNIRYHIKKLTIFSLF